MLGGGRTKAKVPKLDKLKLQSKHLPLKCVILDKRSLKTQVSHSYSGVHQQDFTSNKSVVKSMR